MMLFVAWRKRCRRLQDAAGQGIHLTGDPIDRGQKKALAEEGFRKFGSPGRTRTSDQLINSQPLYQLSYRGMTLSRITRGAAFWSSHWAKSRVGRGQIVANSLFFMTEPS